MKVVWICLLSFHVSPIGLKKVSAANLAERQKRSLNTSGKSMQSFCIASRTINWFSVNPVMFISVPSCRRGGGRGNRHDSRGRRYGSLPLQIGISKRKRQVTRRVSLIIIHFLGISRKVLVRDGEGHVKPLGKCGLSKLTGPLH
jgi:hypothetical protein